MSECRIQKPYTDTGACHINEFFRDQMIRGIQVNDKLLYTKSPTTKKDNTVLFGSLWILLTYTLIENASVTCLLYDSEDY